MALSPYRAVEERLIFSILKLRLVVTGDSRMQGELAGIPIVPHEKLDSTVIKNLKETFFCRWSECDYYTTNIDQLWSHHKEHEKHYSM